MSLAEKAAPAATAALANYVASAALADIPAAVAHEGKRCFINFLGCAAGGTDHDVVAILERALSSFGGPQSASLIASKRRADPLLASLMNATSASAHSFDDTHAEAVVHASGPAGAAALALAESRGVSGADLFLAYCLGLEVNFRLSKAISVSPAVGEIGWYQTGITGGVGAAVAAGKLLRLDAARMNAAIGTAASQAAGIRISQGSMAMLLSGGHAAQVGLRAAFLAAEGFQSPANALEGPYGFLQLFSKSPNAAELTDGLGTRFEILRNTYKAYPCGIVVHPVVDACLALRAEHGIAPDAIESVTVRAAPVALTLTDRPNPASRTAAQVSLQHWTAVTLITGKARLEEGKMDMVERADVKALRGKVKAVADDKLVRDHAEVTVRMRAGKSHAKLIDRPRGGLDNPMTDRDLEEKCAAQFAPYCPNDRVRELIDACWKLEGVADMKSFGRLLGAG